MTGEEKQLFRSLSPEQMVALTIYGEAEGEKPDGKLAVGNVIRNRADLWHKPVHDVCLQANQFECFNDGNARLPVLVKLARAWDDSLPALKDALTAARGVLDGNPESNVGATTFYKRVGSRSPWFDKAVREGRLIKEFTIGKHEFYRETKY